MPRFPTPDEAHRRLFEEIQPRLAYTDTVDLERWKAKLREALERALGRMPAGRPLEPIWSQDGEIAGAEVRRVEFIVDEGHIAIGWLLLHRDAPEQRPTMICLQGHSTGGHISLGRKRFAVDGELIAGDRDYAVQAVEEGFNAFAVEQRAFGEREDGRPLELRKHYDPSNPHTDERCRHMSMVALLLGRTLLGERIYDVTRSIDLLVTLPEIDPNRIGIVGNSGGGTAAYYAAAFDERIAAVMPGCSVATFADSIGAIDHCSDNYLPGAFLDFDLPDLGGLIFPRPIVVVSGKVDTIYPRESIAHAVSQIARIYTDNGRGNAFAHYEGPGGHRFYRAGWEHFHRVTGW